MKLLAIFFVSGMLAWPGIAQTAKPKASTNKSKPSAVKASDKKKTPIAAKAKTADDKTKSSAKKTRTGPVKTPGAAKLKATALKNNPAAPNPASTSQKAKAAAAKPKPKSKLVEPVISAADEEAEYEKASTIVDGLERIAALKRFIKTYPEGKWASDAAGLIVAVRTQLGNDLLTAGDVPGAVTFYKAAIADAPTPVPDQMFADTLAKFPANLYFRGARTEGFEIAKAIEKKAEASVLQMLAVANFYMSVENGSEARRVAENAITLDPASGAAYQTLGLANRMDFLLVESAAAYAKALEIEPESTTARRGLAEMKRALGKADEAVTLYREITAMDAADVPAHTGLVLALFDAGKLSDAEAELSKALEANPGNVILQAGAAYWYAANNEGEKAVDLAQKAIASDPRFIWSHIALARGQISQRNPVAAEKTLLAARRYGNFPTLEYEIASARAAAGFYRDAAEELAKSFTVKEGLIYTNLGGRVKRGSRDLAELIGFERRASIFAPASSDTVAEAARMTALLELKQELDKEQPDPSTVAKAADDFVRGDDEMKVHRLVFAGTQLLEKKIALPKVVELTKSAPVALDAGLNVADPSAAVMASELYESRTIAATRGDFMNIPFVPRATLSSVLRGRVEEINGWAHYQMDDPAQASIHLKRAISVLPADSAWWRSSTWRLGSSLAVEGKNGEALEMYIRSYKSGQPDALRYGAIESLYKRINGHTMGLENRIGPNPSPVDSTQTAVQRPSPTPAIPVAAIKSAPTPETAPPVIAAPLGTLPDTLMEVAKASAEPSPTPSAAEVKPLIKDPVQTASPVAPPEPAPTPSETLNPATEELKVSSIPESSPDATPTPSPLPTAEESKGSRTPDAKVPSQSSVAKETAQVKFTDNTNGLFPPVIINIPPPPIIIAPVKTEPPQKQPETSVDIKTDSPQPPGENTTSAKPVTDSMRVITDSRPRVIAGVPVSVDEIKPCTISLDQDTITIQSSGNERAVVVRRSDDGDVDGLTASTTSPNDVSIRREPLPGVRWTALFIVRSTSAKAGVFQVTFEAPCGKKEVVVRVQQTGDGAAAGRER